MNENTINTFSFILANDVYYFGSLTIIIERNNIFEVKRSIRN